MTRSERRRVRSSDEIIGWSDELTYYVQLTLRRESVIQAGGVEQIPSILMVELLQN